ncbi:hypothetical protein [Micromonospora sp. WMMD1082]|uniref:hypothetical protein n=1 Tax=Micromonospora sp. WMMD1082 TaxID=3016104 RepID=UPI0024171C0E|nr:hypothetical protein [Micromonospora sp. WMMD1082]MDG4795091.1 hypothetical protein [Micromonospora sp. WMMD1082]
MTEFVVAEYTRPSGMMEYRVVPAGEPAARPEATYFQRGQADFHARILSALPARFTVRLRFRTGGSTWVISGNIPGDQTGHRQEWEEGRLPSPSSGHATAEELLLAGVRRYVISAHGRLAEQRHKAKVEARTNPQPDEHGTLMYVWYNPDEWGPCASCGEEYGPHDMVQDTPHGTVCESCCR